MTIKHKQAGSKAQERQDEKVRADIGEDLERIEEIGRLLAIGKITMEERWAMLNAVRNGLGDMQKKHHCAACNRDSMVKEYRAIMDETGLTGFEFC